MVNPMGGSSFDGRQTHNLTTNPYLNTVFEGINQTQNMTQFGGGGFGGGPMGGSPMGGPAMGGPGGAPLIGPMGGSSGGAPTAGQDFLNNFLNPITSTANEQYQSGLSLAQGASSGTQMTAPPPSGPISGLVGGLSEMAGQVPLVGGVVEGLGKAAGGLLNTVSLGIL